jgi:hypothetical protein
MHVSPISSLYPLNELPVAKGTCIPGQVLLLSTNFGTTMPAVQIGEATQKYDKGELELRSSCIHLSRDVLLSVKCFRQFVSFENCIRESADDRDILSKPL